MKSLLAAPPAKLTPSQRLVVELYNNSASFTQIARSLTLLLPISFDLTPTQIEAFHMQPAPKNFLEAFQFLPAMQEKLNAVIRQRGNKFDSYKTEEIAHAQATQKMLILEENSRNNNILRVIPPSWGNGNPWVSPWEMFHQGLGSPQNGELLKIWGLLANSYQEKDG